MAPLSPPLPLSLFSKEKQIHSLSQPNKVKFGNVQGELKKRFLDQTHFLMGIRFVFLRSYTNLLLPSLWIWISPQSTSLIHVSPHRRDFNQNWIYVWVVATASNVSSLFHPLIWFFLRQTHCVCRHWVPAKQIEQVHVWWGGYVRSSQSSATFYMYI